MNKAFAVLGSPIEHSKSPQIHSAAYRVLSEDWSYGRIEIQKGALKRFIENEGAGYSGFSVTMPLKENAKSFADELDDLSLETGATNTLVKRGDKWLGFNTDVFGIMQTVRAKTSSQIKKSVVFGSGATATSAMAAIARLSPNSEVLVIARNKLAAKSIVEMAKNLGLQARQTRFIKSSLAKADLVISTLPAKALDDLAEKLTVRTSFRPKGLLLDVSYVPWPSKIATLWASRGAQVTSGKEMLIWQAIAQIRIFKNGNKDEALLNEVAVIEAMRIAIDE